MAEKTTALYRLVTIPSLYRMFQNALGGQSARDQLRAQFFSDLTGKRALEVGCGPGNWVPHLHGLKSYLGIDWNADHIAQGQQLHGSGDVQFRVGDVGAALEVEERQFDYVFAFGLLHHLDDSQAENLIRSIKDTLSPTGEFISVDPVYHAGQNRIARWMNDRDSGQNIRNAGTYRSLVDPHFGQVAGTICTDKLRVPYSHYIMVCSQPTAGGDQ
jgi:SAM-dependent methyltransferase